MSAMHTIVLEPDVASTGTVDEFERADKPHLNGPPANHLTPGRSAPAERPAALDQHAALDIPPHVQPSSNGRILARLLSMADSYRESGSLRQAMEIYFELVREHSDSPQAHRAEERLFDVARSYERWGELRQARGIYEQLL
jgi:hypothetical protein